MAKGPSSFKQSSGPAWTRERSKPKDLTQTVKELLRYMGPERCALVIGIACTILATVMALIGPKFLETLTDGISASILEPGHPPIDLGWVAGIGMTLTTIYLLSFLLNTAQSYILSAASERIGDRMRRELSAKFHKLPFSYLESHDIGDMMSRVTNDTDTIRKGAAETLTSAVNAVFAIAGSLVMMAYTCLELMVVAIIPTLVGLVILWIVTHNTQRYFRKQTKDLGRMNSVVAEAFYGHDIVRTYDAWDRYREKFDDINESLFQSSFKARVITGMMPQLMHFINNLGYVIICICGSMMIVEGTINYGVIAAFIIYIRQFNNPVTEMADIVARMQSVGSSAERVFEFLSLPEMDEVPRNDALVRAKGRVEFRGVRFGYTDTEIIHGLDLDVEPGSTIAIVGPTGAGKTTIVNLLMRFYDPDSGSILIDGIPTSTLSRGQVREQFSMVLQDSWIFYGTVHDNVAFTNPDATRTDVEEACRTVGIHDYIVTMEDGYDTRLDHNHGLSVGQRQQIAIARAIVKDAPMIILDEATSSVDTRTEKRIQDAMDRMTSGRTAFVIAHRLSTIRDADRILVMVGGEIVESGTHDELLALDGYYRTLHDAQFEERD